jgi:VanZ family protein
MIVAVICSSIARGDSALIRAVENLNDKLMHFASYLALGLLSVFSMTSRRRAIGAAAVMVLMGATLEFVQMSVEGRSADLKDEAANTAGVTCGFLLACGVVRVWTRPPRNRLGF